MSNEIYERAVQEMQQALIANSIHYILKEIHDGYQFLFPEICDGDIVCHYFSYGNENGLWESYKFKWDRGDVTGHLTTEKFISLLKEHYGV